VFRTLAETGLINCSSRKQIESLMAKLNESKQSERSLRTLLDDSERVCNEWQERAADAKKATKNARALQNTIDHLENRLEIANIERLDAEEQLCHLQEQKSPFDFNLSVLQPSSAGEHEHVKVC
jgi:chromosome segregation ATPase